MRLLLLTLALAGVFISPTRSDGQNNEITKLKRLAAQGDAAAQYNLGGMYAEGKGVPQDDAKAVEWFTKAAAQGVPYAQSNLGVMYAEGRGVPQDYAKAMEWYTKAAAQGDADAQNNLGVMYYRGDGVPQDYVQAHKWANLAASKGHKEAVKTRDILAKLMTPDQIAEAQRLAREWRPKPAQP